MYLIDKGANLEIKDIIGKAPIHLAIEYQTCNFVLCLCEKGIDLEMEDKMGKRPIHYAIVNTKPIVANYLIEKGAKLNFKSKELNLLELCANRKIDESIVELIIKKL